MTEIRSLLNVILERFVDRGIAGASAAILVPGMPVVTATAGMANRAKGEKVTPEHLFKIASCTKTFVATTLVSLVASGEVSLDSPIGEWFPEFPALGGLTVRHLINHRSGLPEYEHDIPMGADEEWLPTEIVDFAFRVGIQSDPDQVVSYSNTGYVLAGALIERLTTSSLAEQIRKFVLSPLQLRSTYSLVEENFPDEQLARGYFYFPKSTLLANATLAEGAEMWNMDGILERSPELQDSSYLFSPSALYAAGDMAASATDLVRFMDGLFANEILDTAGLATLTDNRWPADFPGTRIREAGAGLFLSSYAGRELLGHQGSVPGYVSLMLHDAETAINYALLTNTGSGNRLCFQASGLHTVMDEMVVATT
jgi:D-alanyl-D-alanine carboxypeptidase